MQTDAQLTHTHTTTQGNICPEQKRTQANPRTLNHLKMTNKQEDRISDAVVIYM